MSIGENCRFDSQTQDTYQLCQILSTITLETWNGTESEFEFEYLNISSNNYCESWDDAYIKCNGNNITHITLNGTSGIFLGNRLNLNNGNNKFPSNLIHIDLNDQNISGDMYFESFNNCINIEHISLSNNRFTG